MYADKIKSPLLLIHGEADDNDGTFPIQSERMYEAVRGNGGTTRLVFNEYVDVAGIGKAICENRAEEGELPDAVTLADLRDLRFRDLDVGDRHAFFSMANASQRCPA